MKTRASVVLECGFEGCRGDLLRSGSGLDKIWAGVLVSPLTIVRTVDYFPLSTIYN